VRNIGTTAERQGDVYVVNGEKKCESTDRTKIIMVVADGRI